MVEVNEVEVQLPSIVWNPSVTHQPMWPGWPELGVGARGLIFIWKNDKE